MDKLAGMLSTASNCTYPDGELSQMLLEGQQGPALPTVKQLCRYEESRACNFYGPFPMKLP